MAILLGVTLQPKRFLKRRTMNETELPNAAQAYIAQVLQKENRYCQEVTITRVNGICPYGHRKGEVFHVTAMNSGGICGSLLTSIFPSIITLHYGGSLLWEKNPYSFTKCCPENGTVQVAVNRRLNQDALLIKTPLHFKDMTGRGFTALDRNRIFIEVRDVVGSCYWGHKAGDRIEVDPFNVGGSCCFLYAQLYPYLHVLLSGATPPWAMEEHSISGECPDVYNRLCFRLALEKK
ncbi:MAG: TIGR04076 family protein [Pseudomonadota bacterium]